MNTKTLYFIKRVTLLALVAVTLGLIPGAGEAAAQKRSDKDGATSEMLSWALDLRSVSDVAVYADKAVSDKGESAIADGFRRAGSEGDGAYRRDLGKSFDAIRQLPCSEIGDTDLSGKTFAPGVYCLSSAVLSSRLILDGENDSNAVFVFKIAGSLSTKNGSSVEMINGARASGAFFVTEETAEIGAGSEFKGSIIARRDISVGADATVDGRVLSVKGDVALSGNSVLGPQQTGVLEICKVIDSSGGSGLANRVFQFRIGSLITEVPAGGCSGPITVPTGPLVIEELLTGRTTNGAGNFNGNFQLTDVRQLVNTGQASNNALVSANLPLRIANVNIPGPLGDISNQTTIQFTNRFAIIGVIEICKEGIDTGVTGFFNFTIDGLRQGLTPGTSAGTLGTAAPLVNFIVPVGQCTGAIAVTVPADAGLGFPRIGNATIREQARPGFIFTSATTAVGTAGGAPFFNRLINFNANADGGGNATVLVVAGNDGGNGTNVSGDGGATSVQTTVFFNNRTAPGQLKVCKIAGPGVPELTPFTFEVFGIAPFAPVTAPTTVPVNNDPVFTSGLPTTQNPSQGTAQTGATLQGGNFTRREVTVLAGPASNPNGFCQFVAGTFVVDTLALVRETGPTTVEIVNADGSRSGVTGAVRVTRIRSSTGIIGTFGPTFTVTEGNARGPIRTLPTTAFPTNTNFFPGTAGAAGSGISGTTNTGATTGIQVPIRRGVTEVEFVNAAFSPVPLKICKVAGTGITPNTQSFTFTVTQDTAGGLLAPFTSTVTVLAGPRAVNPGDQNGNCDFVGGPFTPTTNALGSFNFNSTITITETGFGSTVIPTGGITSSSGGIITNTGARTALISNMVNGVNEVIFVNQAATAPTIKSSRKRVRFF